MNNEHEAEIIERNALMDLHAAATAELAGKLGLETICDGTSLTSIARELPTSAIVINRSLGLGLEQAATQESIEKIVNAYADAGVDRFFLQVHPDADSPELRTWLHGAGLEKARGWQKFKRNDDPAPAVSTDLRVEQVGAEFGEAFADIVCDAFDLGDLAKAWFALLPGRPDWHVFMSFDGDQPAGCGALYVNGDVAWSDFGATAPAFRRRGSQGAVLATRIDHAISLGCRRIHTCTGEDVAGDPQHSFGNILRMGFEPTYVRQNYAPPKDG
jgi:GNAT superfamily N-acetyltransferase